MRGAKGNMIRAMSNFKEFSLSVVMTELVAIAKCLALAIENGAPKIILVTDCKSAMELILSCESRLIELRSVLIGIFLVR